MVGWLSSELLLLVGLFVAVVAVAVVVMEDFLVVDAVGLNAPISSSILSRMTCGLGSSGRS